MMRPNTPVRSARSTRALRAAVRPFEGLEQRQMMAANAVQSVDTAGPIEQVVEAGGTVYVSSRHGPGSTVSQIWAAKGSKQQSKLLVDFTKTGETHYGIDNLTATADGRVYFTAVGGTHNGHQLYQLNTSKGGYTQITKVQNASYNTVVAVSNKLFMYDGTNAKLVTLNAKNEVKLIKALDGTPKLFAAREQLFFMPYNDGVWRTDGTPEKTYKISPAGLSIGTGDVFAANDYLYIEGSANNNTSLYRSDGSANGFVKIADDFSLLNTTHAELGDYVYFSGGFYNTSPDAKGRQLYRVQTSTGTVSVAAQLPTTNNGGDVDGIAAIGTNIYFAAGDGDFLGSQGTNDRELFRYNTLTGTTKMVTTSNTLYPTDMPGAGVLSTYYFVAAPTKDDARFGSRALYRTSPTDDSVEKIGSLPTTTESNVTGTEVTHLAAGAAGLFAVVQTAAFGKDTDVYFVPTPYSFIDPVTKVLTIDATDASDTLTMKFDGTQVVMNLNGVEERQTIAAFTSIAVNLKGGDDKFTANATVTKGIYVFGDSGNDTLQTGSGNDSLLGGAGKNSMFAGAGDDRIRGSGGVDYCEGQDGNDRIYGRGGSDNLHGGNNVDFIYGDDASGPFGNDVIYGESGNDKLYGFDGNDSLYGGNQNDSLFGGGGIDQILGNDGNDTIDGGTGTDSLWGLAGDDTLLSKDGALDFLSGGDGNDKATRDGKEKGIELLEL